MKLYFAVLMLLLVIMNVSTPAQSVKAYDITEITLKNDGGFGFERGREIVLRKDGTAEYFGGRNSYGRKGKHDGQFDKRKFAQLAKLIIEGGFFSLKKRYETERLDDATVTTSVAYGGRRKTVQNYGQGGGQKLTDIQIAIEAAASEVKWKQVEE